MADMEHQPHQDLAGASAVKMVREIVEKANTCMLVTRHDEFPLQARPMASQGVDEQGTIWFLSSTETGKNLDIGQDARVTLLVQNDSKYQYAQLSGHATIHRDRALIDKYWTKLAETWFNGKDDPRITMVAVHPESGHYWKTRDGKIIASAKMLLGAVGAISNDDGGVDGELHLKGYPT